MSARRRAGSRRRHVAAALALVVAAGSPAGAEAPEPGAYACRATHVAGLWHRPDGTLEAGRVEPSAAQARFVLRLERLGAEEKAVACYAGLAAADGTACADPDTVFFRLSLPGRDLALPPGGAFLAARPAGADEPPAFFCFDEAWISLEPGANGLAYTMGRVALSGVAGGPRLDRFLEAGTCRKAP